MDNNILHNFIEDFLLDLQLTEDEIILDADSLIKFKDNASLHYKVFELYSINDIYLALNKADLFFDEATILSWNKKGISSLPEMLRLECPADVGVFSDIELAASLLTEDYLGHEYDLFCEDFKSSPHHKSFILSCKE